MKRSPLIMTLLIVATLAQEASAQGTLKGRMVYDGKAPKPAVLKVEKDGKFCGQFMLKSEQLVVNPKNGGVKNVAVYLHVSRTGKKPPITAAAKKRPADARIDNQNCRFEPRLIAMTVDQTLTICNQDTIAHITKIDTIDNLEVGVVTSPIIPSGKSRKFKFDVEESLPLPVSCSIHPWMKAYVLVKETPYFAVTDADGNFEIKDLPPGEWTFRFWQERTGYVDKVKFDGKATTWKRGEKRIKIVAGNTVDLEDVLSKFEE